MLKNCFYFSITVAIVTIFPIPKQKNKPFFDLVNKEEDKQIKQKRNSLLIFLRLTFLTITKENQHITRKYYCLFSSAVIKT